MQQRGRVGGGSQVQSCGTPALCQAPWETQGQGWPGALRPWTLVSPCHGGAPAVEASSQGGTEWDPGGNHRRGGRLTGEQALPVLPELEPLCGVSGPGEATGVRQGWGRVSQSLQASWSPEGINSFQRTLCFDRLWEGRGILLGSTVRHGCKDLGKVILTFSCPKANLASNLGLATDGWAGTLAKSPPASLILTFLICRGRADCSLLLCVTGHRTGSDVATRRSGWCSSCPRCAPSRAQASRSPSLRGGTGWAGRAGCSVQGLFSEFLSGLETTSPRKSRHW